MQELTAGPRRAAVALVQMSPIGHNCCKRVEKTSENRDWIVGLKDLAGRARSLMRVDRLIHGNPGAHRNLTHGVSELKVDVGPDYRVYCTLRGDRLLLLLMGGDKSTQSENVARAIGLAKVFGE